MAVTHSYRLPHYGGEPRQVEHELPELEPQDILLRVTHAGVCHSDVYIQDGYQDLGNGERIDFAHSTMPIPLVMGHEIVGEVATVGADADSALIGQRRLVYPWIGCGNCPACRNEQENHCEQPRTLGIFRHGGYAEHVVIPDARYLLKIGELDPAWAATLACSGLTVYSALQQLLPLKPEGAIAIIGAGGLGLSAVALARRLGIESVITCDIADDRLQAARQLGASTTLNIGGESAGSRLSELAQGRLYGVIDTVGLPSTMQLAMDSVAKGARIILVGLQGGRIDLRLPLLPFKALSVIGTYTGSLQELKALIELARQGDSPRCRLPNVLYVA